MVDEIDPVCYPKIVFVECEKEFTVDRGSLVKSELHLNDNESGESRVSCLPCNLNFETEEAYLLHNMEIHSKKQFLCNLCSAVFRRQDHLKRHMLSVHSSSRCCICPVCSKDCKRHDLLLKHIKKRHSDEPQVFHCRECSYECGSLEDLEKHEVTHKSHRHPCPQCQVSFKRRDHMLRHIKSQHLNEYTSCPICNQTYKRKDHVVRHVREKHKMGYLNGKLITSSDIQ